MNPKDDTDSNSSSKKSSTKPQQEDFHSYYFHSSSGFTEFPSNFANYSNPFNPLQLPVFAPNLNSSSNPSSSGNPSSSNDNAQSGPYAGFDCDGVIDSDDDKSAKKRRTNYRRPENAAKLNAAVNALIMQKQDSQAPKDIRSVSKIFNIPYNTLRDNYLRVTTGDIRAGKRQKLDDGESSEIYDLGEDYDDDSDGRNDHNIDDNDSDEKPVVKIEKTSKKSSKPK